MAKNLKNKVPVKRDKLKLNEKNIDVQKALKFILQKMYYVGIPMAISFEDWLDHEDLYEE